jgi:hypothetical protein
MKLQLKGRRFASIEEVQAESHQVLNTLTLADFNECFQKWQNPWNHCIQAQGDYLKVTVEITVLSEYLCYYEQILGNFG